jgi:hypothetical protein
MNTRPKKCDLSELEELYSTLHKEKIKLKELQLESHDPYDSSFYKDYEC